MDPQMDLLQAVKDAELPPAVPDAGSGEFEMPTLEKLLEALEGMDMSDEEKENIKRSLLDKGDILSKMGAGMQNMVPPPPVGIGGDEGTRFIIFAVSIVLVTLIFAFFGYKLYKSLTEKERKREEKKKQKQQKKKK